MPAAAASLSQQLSRLFPEVGEAAASGAHLRAEEVQGVAGGRHRCTESKRCGGLGETRNTATNPGTPSPQHLSPGIPLPQTGSPSPHPASNSAREVSAPGASVHLPPGEGRCTGGARLAPQTSCFVQSCHPKSAAVPSSAPGAACAPPRSVCETVRAAPGCGRLSGAARRAHRSAGSAPRAAALARPPPPLPPLCRRDLWWEEPAGARRSRVPAFPLAAALAPPWPFPPLRNPERVRRGRGLDVGEGQARGPGTEAGRRELARAHCPLRPGPRRRRVSCRTLAARKVGSPGRREGEGEKRNDLLGERVIGLRNEAAQQAWMAQQSAP